MRNHWLQLHRIREAKKQCQVFLCYSLGDTECSTVQPWSDIIKFRMDHLKPGEIAAVESFFIRYQGKKVFEQAFMPGPIWMKKGEELEINLGNLRFYFP